MEAAFAEADLNGDGTLDWNSGEIRKFVEGVLRRLGVAPPPAWRDADWYEHYRRFDRNGDFRMDRSECVDFARFVLAKQEAATAQEARVSAAVEAAFEEADLNKDG